MKKYILLFACPLLFSIGVKAQGLFEGTIAASEEQSGNNSVELNGYARGSAFGAGENFDYSSVFGEFSLQSKYSHNKTFLFSDVRFRSGLTFNEDNTIFEIKEAYAGYTGDKLDILLGNQIIAWGRTDGFNPTNNITPNNYFFLTADNDDQKMSNFLLRAKYRLTPEIDFDLIGIPFYKPSVYRFDLFDHNGNDVSFLEPVIPDRSFENSSFAIRLNFELPKAGFSVSWFRGYDPFYGYNVDTITVNPATFSLSIENIATPYLKNTIGGDFSIPLNSWIIRGEAAYNITGDGYDSLMYVPNPDLSYVIGAEKTLSGFTTIVQYVGKYTLDFTELTTPTLLDPLNPLAQLQYAQEVVINESALFNRKIFHQQEEMNHILTLMVTKSFAYDTWNVELAGYYDITSEEYLIRPKLTWKLTDALSTSAGYSYMNGPEKSVFSYSNAILNGGFFELKANF
ncbi:MAG: hypothetical protein JXB17_07685 [Bacteroidales bacterium]|nr:hypothetical protein [Bacteroidales bacterium]